MDKSKRIPYGIFSILFSLSFSIGGRVYKDNVIGIKSFSDGLVLLFETLLLAVIIYAIIWGISKGASILNDKFPGKLSAFGTTFLGKPFSIKNRWIGLLIFTIVILICWIPCFLSYYPMMDAYDIFYKTPYWFQQHSQALTGNYIKHHSVLHTFFWSLAIKTGDALKTRPFVPYALGQMFVMAIVFSKTLVYLNSKSVAKIWTVLALVFYAFPVNAIFSQIPTKDVSMAPVLLLLILNLYRLFSEDPGYKAYLGIPVAIIEAVICCLLRNNFIYAFFVFAILAFIIQKKARKPFAVFALATVAIFKLIDGPVYSAIGVYPGEKHEALCVPIQQLAYTMIEAPQKLSPEDRDEIMMYFPKYKNYNPRFADPVKDNADDEILESNLTNFVKLWVKVGLKCPGEYIDSFLTLNIPYWYLGASPLDPYSERQYIETGDKTDHTPLLSLGLFDFYEKESNFSGVNSLPIIKVFFLLATPIWLLIFGICFRKTKKDKNAMTVLSLLLLYMLTFLLGPVSCMRYIYPIFVTYPMIIYLTWQKNN